MGKLRAGSPFDGFKDLIGNFSPEGWHREEDDLDEPVGIAVAQPEDLVTDLGVNPELLRKLAMQTLFQVLAVAQFSAGEFPLKAIRIRVMSLANQDALAV